MHAQRLRRERTILRRLAALPTRTFSASRRERTILRRPRRRESGSLRHGAKGIEQGAIILHQPVGGQVFELINPPQSLREKSPSAAFASVAPELPKEISRACIGKEILGFMAGNEVVARYCPRNDAIA